MQFERFPFYAELKRTIKWVYTHLNTRLNPC